MIKKIDQNTNHKKRHTRVRNKVSGTNEKPRLSVYRSNTCIYAQLIDDVADHILAQVSTLDKALELDSTKDMDTAKAVGTLVVGRAKEKETEEAVFDRSGYIHHGCITALAGTAGETGSKF